MTIVITATAVETHNDVLKIVKTFKILLFWPMNTNPAVVKPYAPMQRLNNEYTDQDDFLFWI